MNCRKLLLVLIAMVSIFEGIAFGTSYTFMTIDAPNSYSTYVYGINNSGQMVGTYYDAYGPHGFSFSNNTFTTLDTPLGHYGSASGLNNNGAITGQYSSYGGRVLNYVLDNGIFTYGTSGSFQGINDNNTLLGWDGWTGKNYTSQEGNISYLNFNGFAWGINNNNIIVGESGTLHNNKGLVYNNGIVTELSYKNADSTSIRGINNLDNMVGLYQINENNPYGTFVSIDGVLSEFYKPGSLTTLGLSINDSGEIGGTYSDSTGYHGMLATPILPDPVPEPSTFLLFGIGIVGLGVFSRGLQRSNQTYAIK